MGFKRLGGIFLGLIFSIMLVSAIPVSTAQEPETIPKEPVILSKTTQVPLETNAQVQYKLQEIAEKSEDIIEEAANKNKVEEAIKCEVVAEEVATEEIIADEVIIEEEVIEEEIDEDSIEEEIIEEPEETTSEWQGEVLNAYVGVVQGPSGKETYYNLLMGGVIEIMKSLGYDYEYWVREDGVKMYGDYIMCAANLEIRPKGTILETSLGTAMVCDTGSFAESNPYQIDIAVDW